MGTGTCRRSPERTYQFAKALPVAPNLARDGHWRRRLWLGGSQILRRLLKKGFAAALAAKVVSPALIRRARCGVLDPHVQAREIIVVATNVAGCSLAGVLRGFGPGRGAAGHERD